MSQRSAELAAEILRRRNERAPGGEQFAGAVGDLMLTAPAEVADLMGVPMLLRLLDPDTETYYPPPDESFLNDPSTPAPVGFERSRETGTAAAYADLIEAIMTPDPNAPVYEGPPGMIGIDMFGATVPAAVTRGIRTMAQLKKLILKFEESAKGVEDYTKALKTLNASAETVDDAARPLMGQVKEQLLRDALEQVDLGLGEVRETLNRAAPRIGAARAHTGDRASREHALSRAEGDVRGIEDRYDALQQINKELREAAGESVGQRPDIWDEVESLIQGPSGTPDPFGDPSVPPVGQTQLPPGEANALRAIAEEQRTTLTAMEHEYDALVQVGRDADADTLSGQMADIEDSLAGTLRTLDEAGEAAVIPVGQTEGMTPGITGTSPGQFLDEAAVQFQSDLQTIALSGGDDADMVESILARRRADPNLEVSDDMMRSLEQMERAEVTYAEDIRSAAAGDVADGQMSQAEANDLTNQADEAVRRMGELIDTFRGGSRANPTDNLPITSGEEVHALRWAGRHEEADAIVAQIRARSPEATSQPGNLPPVPEAPSGADRHAQELNPLSPGAEEEFESIEDAIRFLESEETGIDIDDVLEEMVRRRRAGSENN